MQGSNVSEPKREARKPVRAASGTDVHDVIGVGFGPANLALAVCLEELAEEAGGRDLARLFLEIKPKSVWHPGMLLEDSQLQISVLKDLAMVRNPRSRFTFLSYLKEKDRLFEFLNLRDLFPTRIEFNDYLCWVADQLRQRVRYGKEVLSVHPVPESGEPVRLLRVLARDIATDAVEEHLTRNLVLATGGAPRLPEGIRLRPNGRAFHSHEFMLRIKRDFPDQDAPHRFVVVGSGQSAAELFCYLLEHYPQADVTATIRRFSYKPCDDSDFTNEIFFPQMVDFLYDLPDEKRQMILDDVKEVNYAVVDLALIRRIYRCLYKERVEGKFRARIKPFMELVKVEERPGGAVAEFTDLLRERPVTVEADAIVISTGYEWKREHPLLDPLASYFERDGSGSYRIGRDYRLAADSGFEPRVYMQGFAEQTHGASETVLSLLPVRAEEIVQSILAASSAQRAAVAV